MTRPRTLAALALAGALALSGCGGTKQTTAPAPITRTVTATPDPVVEVQVPESCLNALTAAEDFGSITSEVLQSASILPQLILDAYQAGVTGGSLDEVGRKLDASTTVITAATPKTERAVARFTAARDACRSKAGR